MAMSFQINSINCLRTDWLRTSPLLVGWNADEGTPFPPFAVTRADFQDKAQRIYGDRAAQFLALYPMASDSDAQAQAFAPFGQGALAWEAYTPARAHQATSQSKKCVYYFTRAAVVPRSALSRTGPTIQLRGLPLGGTAVLLQQPGHISPAICASGPDALGITSSFLVNFATTGDPNTGPRTGLPNWPAYTPAAERVMDLGDGDGPSTSSTQSTCNGSAARCRSKATALTDLGLSRTPHCPQIARGR
jgi:para-nitrobenzyl esterase